MPDSYELYLIRHAVAEERGDKWPDDSRRPLTEDGIARMKKNARGLLRIGVALDVVLTSPFVRARQTADIVAAAFSTRPPIVVIDSLSTDGSPQAVITDLESHSRRGRIALVGHEPGIGELAAKLTGARRALEFKKGGVCRIDVESIPPAGPGTLKWFLTPRIMRELRK
jgi:phosphohistidine phosphatase